MTHSHIDMSKSKYMSNLLEVIGMWSKAFSSCPLVPVGVMLERASSILRYDCHADVLCLRSWGSRSYFWQWSPIQTEDILSPDCVEAAIVRNMDKHLDKIGFRTATAMPALRVLFLFSFL